MTKKLPIEVAVRVGTLTPHGETFEISASQSERAALADLLDLVEVSRFDARIAVKPTGNGAVAIDGRIEAAFVQNCVLTLEPIDQTVAESFELALVPEGSNEAEAPAPAVDVEPDQPDPPDTYTDDQIDVGAIAVEQFALSIDAYPRAPGAAFPEEGVGDDPAAIGGPFADLARLKDQSEGDR